MRKITVPDRAKRANVTAPAKPAKQLVGVRKAAQKPVHATRSEIRRAVRAVAAERV